MGGGKNITQMRGIHILAYWACSEAVKINAAVQLEKNVMKMRAYTSTNGWVN